MEEGIGQLTGDGDCARRHPDGSTNVFGRGGGFCRNTPTEAGSVASSPRLDIGRHDRTPALLLDPRSDPDGGMGEEETTGFDRERSEKIGGHEVFCWRRTRVCRVIVGPTGKIA